MDPFRLLFLASSMVPLFLSVPYTAPALQDVAFPDIPPSFRPGMLNLLP